MKDGYHVQPAVNGGFTVHKEAPLGYVREHAAFSSASDMLEWLTKGHT